MRIDCMVEVEYQMPFQWFNWHETLSDVLQLCNGEETLPTSLHQCLQVFVFMCVKATTRHLKR
jgi:hypothetical protein